MDKKRIVITEGEPFQFVGRWTVGEIQAAAQALANYVAGLGVPETQPETPDITTSDGTP